MLKSKRIRLAAVVAALCAIGATATAIAATGSDDSWNAGANSPWAAALSPGSTAKFTSTLVTITCTDSTAGGPTIGAAPDVGALPINRPTFNNGTGVPCTTNLGASATVTTLGTWHYGNFSDKTYAHCPAGTGNDETTNKDCEVIGVPKGGATVKLGSPLNCTLTIAPSGIAYIPLTVNDPGGTTPTTFTIANAQVPFTGCGTSGTGTQTGTYTLSAPNGGVLFDNS